MNLLCRFVVALVVALDVALVVPACALDYTVSTGASGASEGDDDTCPDGHVLCGERCVDLDRDPSQCGACGNDCADGACLMGRCEAACTVTCDPVLEVCAGDTCACRPGLERCGAACVDTTSDPAHCGGCDDDCGADPCGGSLCLPGGCAGFSGECDGSCVDLESDPLHCGECESECESDELCVDSECREADESLRELPL